MPPPNPSSDCLLFREIAAEGGKVSPRAREAQEELYKRHAGYLLAVFQRRTERVVRVSGISPEDLLQETFVRAFARASSYRCLETPDLDEERRRTRAWLGRIAERLLFDQLRKSREVPSSPEMDEMEDVPPSSGSPGAALVRDAIEQLSEREQDILRVTALFHRVGEAHQRLPNEVARELAERWGVSQDNLRALRMRALAKIKGIVEGARARNGSKEVVS